MLEAAISASEKFFHRYVRTGVFSERLMFLFFGVAIMGFA